MSLQVWTLIWEPLSELRMPIISRESQVSACPRRATLGCPGTSVLLCVAAKESELFNMLYIVFYIPYIVCVYLMHYMSNFIIHYRIPF